MGNWSVNFTGFKTKEQAEAFAAWYGKIGEQDSAIWLEEYTNLSGAYEKERSTDLTTNTVEMKLKLYEK